MPKISTKSIKVDQGDHSENFDFTVHYNGDLGFYAEIPEIFHEQFDQLTESEQKEFGAKRKYKYKYSSGEHKKVVVSDTENGVVDAMRKICTKLMTMAVEKVPVIIVRFENETDTRSFREEGRLHTVGLKLSAVYCFKVSTGSDKVKYYTYRHYEFLGEKKVDRQEITGSWRQEQTIIPDTPENRQFIEDLHNALGTLVAKMVAFTATTEDMMAVIEQRQKLLTL